MCWTLLIYNHLPIKVALIFVLSVSAVKALERDGWKAFASFELSDCFSGLANVPVIEGMV